MAGIPTGNILQPGVVTTSSGVNYSIITGLQLLTPVYWKRYVERYGPEAYDYFFQWLATFGGMEYVKNQNFFWYESRGKNQLAVTNLSQITAPAAGATVTVDIPASEIYDSTYSPLRVGETVYVASSNIEGEILTVPSTSQCTIRPKKSSEAFVSAGSANLEAGEILVFGGITDVGEASGERESQTHLDVRMENNITPIREFYAATDFAEMSDVWYDEGVTGSAPNGVNQSGTSFFTYKALVKTDRRFLNSIETKLMRGDAVTNTGLLNNPTTGCQGFIPTVTANGETVNYTPGTLDIAKLHQITRIMKVNGCAKENIWLQDIFQRQDFSDGIFKEYPAGAFVYGEGEKSKEASVAYGFQEILIDGTLFKVKEYSPWNTEVQTGLTPQVDYFRNFGLIAPQGGVPDAKTYTQLKNIQIMAQQPQKGGTVGNGIRVWAYGGGSVNPTDATLIDKITMATYRSVRTAGSNQFVIVSA
ncbi:MAG TPA: hypothetical protein PKV73_01120 [Agriterribacter sp.]|nr:hypothetical protein [Agriterribacter sp.]